MKKSKLNIIIGLQALFLVAIFALSSSALRQPKAIAIQGPITNLAALNQGLAGVQTPADIAQGSVADSVVRAIKDVRPDANTIIPVTITLPGNKGQAVVFVGAAGTQAPENTALQAALTQALEDGRQVFAPTDTYPTTDSEEAGKASSAGITTSQKALKILLSANPKLEEELNSVKSQLDLNVMLKKVNTRLTNYTYIQAVVPIRMKTGTNYILLVGGLEGSENNKAIVLVSLFGSRGGVKTELITRVTDRDALSLPSYIAGNAAAIVFGENDNAQNAYAQISSFLPSAGSEAAAAGKASSAGTPGISTDLNTLNALRKSDASFGQHLTSVEASLLSKSSLSEVHNLISEFGATKIIAVIPNENMPNSYIVVVENLADANTHDLLLVSISGNNVVSELVTEIEQENIGRIQHVIDTQLLPVTEVKNASELPWGNNTKAQNAFVNFENIAPQGTTIALAKASSAGVTYLQIGPAQVKEISIVNGTTGAVSTTTEWDILSIENKFTDMAKPAGVVLAKDSVPIENAKAQAENIITKQLNPLPAELGKITDDTNAGKLIPEGGNQLVQVPVSNDQVLVMEMTPGSYTPVAGTEELNAAISRVGLERSGIVIDFNALGTKGTRTDGTEVFIPNDFVMQAITIINQVKAEALTKDKPFHFAVWSNTLSANEMQNLLGALGVAFDSFVSTGTVAKAVNTVASENSIDPKNIAIDILRSTVEANPGVLAGMEQLATAVRFVMLNKPGNFVSYKTMLLQSLNMLTGIIPANQLSQIKLDIENAPEIRGLDITPAKSDDAAISRMQAAVAV